VRASGNGRMNALALGGYMDISVLLGSDRVARYFASPVQIEKYSTAYVCRMPFKNKNNYYKYSFTYKSILYVTF
jgi:hypothetical protein